MKTVVFTFGRFNPPTIGHAKLIDKVADVARKERGDYKIYPTQSHDAKKNPLSYKEKLYWMQLMFPNHKKAITKTSAKTVIDVAQQLQNGYDRLVMVVGDDRVADFGKLLKRYNGKEYHFDQIEVVSAGQRDPDADDVSGMSASKMRQAVIDNDYGAFVQGIPNTLNDMRKEKLWNNLRVRMGIKESIVNLSFKEFIELMNRK